MLLNVSIPSYNLLSCPLICCLSFISHLSFLGGCRRMQSPTTWPCVLFHGTWWTLVHQAESSKSVLCSSLHKAVPLLNTARKTRTNESKNCSFYFSSLWGLYFLGSPFGPVALKLCLSDIVLSGCQFSAVFGIQTRLVLCFFWPTVHTELWDFHSGSATQSVSWCPFFPEPVPIYPAPPSCFVACRGFQATTLSVSSASLGDSSFPLGILANEPFSHIMPMTQGSGPGQDLPEGRAPFPLDGHWEPRLLVS